MAQKVTGWVGWVYFAGFFMLLAGIFQAIEGLEALVKNNIYVVGPNNVFVFNLTQWGWIHLALGVLIAIAGVAVLNGRVWGRTIGVILALVAAVANFAFIPVYPIWSVSAIVINLLVIYALTAHGSEAAA